MMLKTFLFIAVLAISIMSTISAASNTNLEPSGYDQAKSDKTRVDLQGIVDSRITMYNRIYPDVMFLQLAGGNKLVESLESLQLFLGHEPENLDYEHPPELREDLVYVTLQTIILMLENDASSATLFGVGANSFAERSYLCVITLTPGRVAGDEKMTTQDLMLDVTEKEFSGVGAENYLKPAEYLKYNIDHEVYHCLDSLFNGPVPVSKLEYWGEYMAYRRHMGADSFALGMHMREHGGVTDFVRTIGKLRALSVLYGDPNHYSHIIMRDLLNNSPGIHPGTTVRELFVKSGELRDTLAPDYEAYLVFIASAYSAMKSLGRSYDIHPTVADNIAPDSAMVMELFDTVMTSYKEIFGTDLVPVKQSP